MNTRPALLVTMAFLLPAAGAQDLELEPQTHRLQWTTSSGELLKDVEWTTRPVVRIGRGAVEVVVASDGVRHVDEYAGVAGEIRFNAIERSLRSVEVELTDGRRLSGSTNIERRIRLRFEPAQVLAITTRHEARGETSEHRWWVDRPTQSPEDAIAEADRLVAGEEPARRIPAARRVVYVLAPHREDRDLLAAAGVIDRLLERRMLLDRGLERTLDAVRSASDDPSREMALRELRRELLDRGGHLLSLLPAGDVDVEDARRMLNLVKYGAQAIDDAREPSALGGPTSLPTAFLTAAHGAAAMAEGVRDQEARRLMDGLRDTVGALESRVGGWQAAPLDLPGEVAAAMLDVTRRGLDETTATLEDVAAAIGGDAAALDRAIEGSRRVEEILSGPS